MGRIGYRYSEETKKKIGRDNHKCVLCGEGGDLQIDHIQSWADYVELRFNIENCRTLCIWCHYKVTYRKIMPTNINMWAGSKLKKYANQTI